MKKSWGKPIVQVQLFVPQDCVAACSLITDQYLDYGGNNGQLNNGHFDQGESVNDEGVATLANREGTYFGVKAYNSRGFLSDNYSGYITTYPVVDIRYWRTSWIIFTYYRAYNATS